MSVHELRPEEEWARVLIAEALGNSVSGNDYNSGYRTYDLRIDGRTAVEAAIEVVQATDSNHRKAWKSGAGQGPWQVPGLRYGWILTATPLTNMKMLRMYSGSLLLEVEREDLQHVDQYHPVFGSKLRRLRLSSATRVGPLAGKVYITLESTSAFVSDDGAPLVQWLPGFLSTVPDVLEKLRVQARERHVFVPVDVGGAPAEVLLYLTHTKANGLPPVPTAAPTLPPPVSHAWVICTFARYGVRWDGTRWRVFEDVTRR